MRIFLRWSKVVQWSSLWHSSYDLDQVKSKCAYIHLVALFCTFLGPKCLSSGTTQELKIQVGVWVGSFFGFWREFLRFLLKRFSMHLGGNSWFGLPIWVYNRWWHLHVFEWAHPFERSVVEGAGVRVISLRKTKPVCTCARAIVIGFVCPYNFELLSCMAFYHVRNFATHPILACVHLVICNALQFSYYSVTCRY